MRYKKVWKVTLQESGEDMPWTVAIFSTEEKARKAARIIRFKSDPQTLADFDNGKYTIDVNLGQVLDVFTWGNKTYDLTRDYVASLPTIGG